MSDGGKGSKARPISVDTATFDDRWAMAFGKKPAQMVVCAECGNKRCPQATDPELTCTNSNEPGQPGSSY